MPDLLAAIRTAPSGTGRFRTFEGLDVYTAWAPTATGWTVGIDTSTAPIDAKLVRSLGTIFGVGLLACAASVAAVVAWSGRLSRAIEAAATAAGRLAQGKSPLPTTSVVDEIQALHDAHQAADARLRQAEADRARLLASEQAARIEAEQSNRAKDEFLAMLGHELRNPLAAISHAAAVVDMVGKRDDAAARPLAIIRRQVAQLTRIVDDLLDVARLRTGHIALLLRPVNLAQAVEQCLAGLAAQLRGRRIALDLTPVWVNADEARLEQIVANLVTNALKYTPVDRSIRIAVTAERADAVLRVEDEGMGIPPALLPHVFDLFVQGQRTPDRRLGGLGLGLTLVRRLVELHNGNVEVESPGPGGGSTFTVRLPAHVPVSAAEAPRPTIAAIPPLRVLLVEDNDDARDALKMVLEQGGHKIYEAVDGPTGVAAALRYEPDVALVDVGLPGYPASTDSRWRDASGPTWEPASGSSPSPAMASPRIAAARSRRGSRSIW
ncbi:MAG: hybrid sensor histidine kinase/response regulator [Chloroflexi bacterium]|nr:hybrid sensor histidine kinase/response regulator [Chloroflexota bacterium]